MRAAVAAVCLALALSGVAADFTGEGTYYGDNGWEGYCKGNVLAQGGKWPPNNWSGLKVAMNQAQLLNGNKWGDTKECGKMVTIRGTGNGLGGSPISKNWETAMITNMCPECKYGDIDYGRGGDGRWDIEWIYGSTAGGGTNHVDSASKARAIVPKPKAAPKAAPKPAPRPAPKLAKKKCDAACKKANIRAALMKWRRRVANARRYNKRVAASRKYNARLRAARLKARGRKLLSDSA